jgi:hypothetical protein
MFKSTMVENKMSEEAKEDSRLEALPVSKKKQKSTIFGSS